jgi:hypothetical protein
VTKPHSLVILPHLVVMRSLGPKIQVRSQPQRKTKLQVTTIRQSLVQVKIKARFIAGLYCF